MRIPPSPLQNLLAGLFLPLLSVTLLPVSLLVVCVCVVRGTRQHIARRSSCVIISGGRMSKGLALARAFKRAGWTVIGIEETGWGELCPMRFSSSVDHFYLTPSPTTSLDGYTSKICSIAKSHSANLFIPVSGVASSVEDAQLAKILLRATDGRCETFIQDEETMEDLHDKDLFMALVESLDMRKPRGSKVESVEGAMQFLSGTREPIYVLKCMGIDENRGDMTLYPLKNTSTRMALKSLRPGISENEPYVFQEFITGQEWCTHASVVDGHLTSFVACPSNDMLMTYEDATTGPIGVLAEQWTRTFLERLRDQPTATGKTRRVTGHFSFDFILSTRDGQLYPIECNARVHTAIILLPLSGIASCYPPNRPRRVLRPNNGILPRSWLYNDIVMRYLPQVIRSRWILSHIHPSLPACTTTKGLPSESLFMPRVDPTLVADDWLPFLVFWHVFWPWLLLTRWWSGRRWTRLNVSTGRIFEI